MPSLPQPPGSHRFAFSLLALLLCGAAGLSAMPPAGAAPRATGGVKVAVAKKRAAKTKLAPSRLVVMVVKRGVVPLAPSAVSRPKAPAAGKAAPQPRKRSTALPAAAPSWWESAGVEVVAAGKGRINYEAGVVKATGLGALAPPTLSRSHAQDTLDARQAALADALRTLAVAVGRVRVTANTRVENLVLKDDEVRLRVDGVLDRAQVIEESASPSGVYRVVVQIPLTGAGSVSEAVGVGDAATPASEVAAALEPKKPEFGLEAPVPAGATYTGLIVDCRGLKVAPCMSPKLFDPVGDEVYGTLPVSPEYANETGIVGYPRSMDSALRLARVGDRPLVVRAVGCADRLRFFPVLSRRDADTVRTANASDRFLQRTAVVFIVDPL